MNLSKNLDDLKFDNLDENLYLDQIKNLKNSCFVIVSKSGNTLETIVNTGVLYSKTKLKNKSLNKLIDMGASYLIINKNAPVLKDSVVIIGYTDHYVDDTNNVYLYDLKQYKD